MLILVAVLVSVALHPRDAAAADASVGSVDAQQVIREGLAFEKERRWGDALSLYQKGLREHPENARLKQRRAIARIHFDMDRRYSDTSFIRTIQETDGNTALNVYAEVLLKIQSYYVDEPDWAELASYGLTSVEVGMMSPEFRKVNLPGVNTEQVRAAIIKVRKQLESTTVDSRHDAYLVATTTAQALKQSLNLSTQGTVYEFVCGAISALDPYSAFMSSNQYSETMSQIEGNFVGLGVELRTHADHLEIVSVIPGGSASVGGIVAGDRITSVDRQSVAEIGSERAADLMRGVEGSFVQLVVDRGQGLQAVTLERRRVEIPSVDQVSIVDAESGVGYIRLTNFQKTTSRDFDAAMWKLHRQGMRSLIVDVRGNPGGLLSASVEVADRFVGNGVIVSTKGRNPMEDYTHRANVSSTWRVPLVVLVDENSASASEIFAAAIRDHHRGTIVGHRSYGKGSVQGIFPLNVSGGGVRLTTARFYSPTGKAISQVGVKADVLVHQTAHAGSSNLASENSDAGMRVGIKTARVAAEKRAAAQRQTASSKPQPSFERPAIAGR
jgi:carboxyl-terminal processing protease